MCETEIKIAYIKKHVYKERKETRYGEIGEEQHTSYIYIYILEINTMYVINKWSQDQCTRGYCN